MRLTGIGGQMAKHGLMHRRGRTSRTGDWLRMGVFSATVLAPLVARWNDLRMAQRAKELGKDWGTFADEQTRELRRLAAERARELSELAAERSQDWAELARARSNEWRDLVADRASEWSGVAGERAHALGDQALVLSDDLLALAAGRAGDLRKQAASTLEDARQQFLATKAYDTLKDTVPIIAKLDNRRRRRIPPLWLIGAACGLVAGIAGFVILRRRLGVAPEEPLVELPQTGPNGAGARGRGPAATAPGTLASQRAAAQEREIGRRGNSDTFPDANAAPIVGNIHTKVYHDATDDNLPTEENRIYFASEGEARAAGYRSARPTAVEHNESRSPRP
jgi:hypothetical protein